MKTILTLTLIIIIGYYSSISVSKFDGFNYTQPTSDLNETINGSATSVYTNDTFYYSSTIDDISNLMGVTSFDDGFTNQPIVFLMHGWNGNATTITYTEMEDYSSEGYFVVNLGLRGRNGADGARDASGRELYDLIDAIDYIRANYATYVSEKKVSIVGFSGGGGNVQGLLVKAPDLFSSAASYYGMSDYYYNASESWGATNPAFLPTIRTAVGRDYPANQPYYCRLTYDALTNYKLGFMYFFHKTTDGTVDVRSTEKIDSALSLTDYTNYEADINELNPGHSNYSNYRLSDVVDAVLSTPSWTTATSDSLWVKAFLKTKRFEIRLDDMESSSLILQYDVDRSIYLLTPITSGDIDVLLTNYTDTVLITINKQTEIKL